VSAAPAHLHSSEAHHTDSLARARLGVIGGTGLYAIEDLQGMSEHVVTTPFGTPSDALQLGRFGELEVVFLARHGRDHHLLPSEVPYRANLWALRSIGVRWVLSFSAVGSLQERYRPLDVVVPDQFIDRTCDRPASFFGGGAVAHVSLADPFCPILSDHLARSAEACVPADRRVHRGGTYLCTEGPAFSTRAESSLYQAWGCAVIGMTNHTEACLAKEAEMAYASLAMVTDYDCWHDSHADVSVDLVIGNLRANASLAQRVVQRCAGLLASSRPSCPAHHALRDALMTRPGNVPEETRHRIDLFTSPYWGPLESSP